MVSLFTIALIAAAGYWLFFMGGVNTLKSLVGGGGSFSSQHQSSSQTVNGINGMPGMPGMSQNGVNVNNSFFDNFDTNSSAIQNRVNEMLAAQGIDMSQPNINIQRRDSNNNNLNVQKSSRFANANSFFVNSNNGRVRAF